MKIIALVNQKGGVAKTTTAANLSWGLAKKGKKVLAIDFDPQGSLSSSMGAVIRPNTPTVFEWLNIAEGALTVPFAGVVQHCRGVDLVPANVRFSQAELLMSQRLNREQILKRAIKSIPKNQYDYIIIDNPPALNILTINSLAAADEVIIPVAPDWLVYEGAAALRNTIFSIKDEVNFKLKVKGFLITMHLVTRNIDDIMDLVQELAEQCNSKIFKQTIRQNADAKDAPSHCKSIFDYKPSCAAAKDYLGLVEEFLEDENNGN